LNQGHCAEHEQDGQATFASSERFLFRHGSTVVLLGSRTACDDFNVHGRA
jgi:hypothetical protein